MFKKAGDTFQIDIKAMAWESANDGDICAGNQTTPNFVLPNIALGSTLMAPNPGTNAAVGMATYNHVPASNSLNSVTDGERGGGIPDDGDATAGNAARGKHCIYGLFRLHHPSRQQRAGGPLRTLGL